MSLQIFIRAIKFINFVIVAMILVGESAWADWSIDLSRRHQEIRRQDLVAPTAKPEEAGFFGKLLSVDQKASDIVILNTRNGFLPETVRLMQGMKYRLHIVNVNEGEKNVSFILDAFSEHHATYYGSIKSFEVEPKTEGVYSFQCPETSTEGRVVVYESDKGLPMRVPASE